MSKRGPLQRRILVAYFMLAIGGAILFAFIAALAVEGIEERLVDERLKSIAAWASPRNIAGMPVEMPAGVIFYHGPSIPASLRGLEPGVREKNVDGAGLHLLVGKDAAGDFVVVDHATDYERIERVVYSVVAAGLLAMLGLSSILGHYMARSVVNPITSLAAAVLEDESKTVLPLLDRKDELGTLARAFAARTAEMRGYLVRERFFTGDVSHELRTPLTVIIGAAEILVQRTGRQPELNAPAVRILNSAREAADCVNVLLLLARAPQSLDAPENRIAPIVEEEVERGKLACLDKTVSVSSSLVDDPVVFARRELISTAIGNLVRNACQYTEKGSVLVRVEGRSVFVEDTGPGLPAAVRSRLFDDIQASNAGSSLGTGIGLALVKRICEYMGARLTAEDRVGGGTVFAVEFPAGLTKA